MKFSAKRLLFLFLPMLIIFGTVRVGMYFGEFYAMYSLRLEAGRLQKERCLTGVLTKDQQSAAATAYLDPARANRDMHHFSWLIPSAPAPFVGIVPQPGSYDNAHINAQFCRANREVQMPKPTQTVRLFLTGGSVAYGTGAPAQNQTIGALLETRLNERLPNETGRRYEVFIQANPGWASTHERILIENRIVDLAPDLVIAFSGYNDAHYARAGENVLWLRTPQEELFWHLNNEVMTLTGFPQLPSLVAVPRGPVAPSLVAERLARNIRLAALALEPGKVPFVFCLQPCLSMTKKPLTQRETNQLQFPEYFQACYREFQRTLPGLPLTNFHWVDLTGTFDALPPHLEVFLDNCHFGDRGNDLLAEALFQRLLTLLTTRP